MKYYAKDYQILPGKEVGKELNDLFSFLTGEEEKEIVFEKGEYYIDTHNCPVRYFHATNTMGEKEYREGEEKWKRRVAFLLEGIKNLTVNGNGAVFIIDGIADNVAFINCENVVFGDLEIKVSRPNAHRLVTTKRSLTKLALSTDPDDKVVTENGEIFFVGKDYKHPLMYRCMQRYFNSADPDRPSYFTRILHPLFGTRKIEYKDGVITAKGLFPSSRFKVGREYYIYDNRRMNVGVFAQGCNNLTLKNYTQRFSYSLAVVCQDCENLTFDGLNLSPEDIKKFGLASIADFLHLCCCRGQITVKNSYFSSSGDDVLNVHGVHFKIASVKDKTIDVKFCHEQAYGYNVFHPGDKIAVIDRSTLLQQTTATIETIEMVDLYTIRLGLDTAIDNCYIGEVVENTSACPDVLFEKNRFERISTRGLLVTTRGKVLIRDNDFLFTKMWAIEVADDGRDWYESGMVCDLTVENNRFHECTQEMIHIFPHNLVHKGYVHNNITIRNNEFHLKKRRCYIVRSAGNVRICGNKYICPTFYKKYLLKITSDIKETDF